MSDSPSSTAARLDHRYDPTIGVSSPNWCPTSPPNGIAADTRPDDARSLTFELPIANEPVELLGQARAILHVASTAPVAFFTVKLVDVAPDGRSTFITRGTLNATRRNGMDAPEPLDPGAIYELEIPLKAVSWVLEPGHRLRVSIASADWPTIWPSPYPATNSLFLGPEHPSRIVLPTVPAGRSTVSEAPSYNPPPEMPATTDAVGSPEISWRSARDEVTGAVEVHLSSRSAHAPHGLGATISRDSVVTASIHPDDPGGASMVGSYGFEIRTEAYSVQSNSEATIQATPEQFQVTIRLEVDRNGDRIAERTWSESIPRDLL